MSFLMLTGALAAPVMAGGLAVRRWVKARQAERSRDQARLRVVEGQLATLRAMLRIGQAEYLARQRMQAGRQVGDVFANTTIHEEPEQWR